MKLDLPFSICALVALALCGGCSSNDSGPTDGVEIPPEDASTDGSFVIEEAGPLFETSIDAKPDSDGGKLDADAAKETSGDVSVDAPSTKCTSGAIESEACGKCGTRSRLCGDGNVWLDWGACGGETGACKPADSRSVTCGKCGKRTETCSVTCEWEPGACTDEGVCNAGEFETQYGGCSLPKQVKTRTCGTTCKWSDWGVCAVTKGWDDMASPTGISFQGRQYHSAVWTGTDMLVWGGQTTSYYNGDANGAAYNPSKDTWTALPAVPSSFVGRYYQSAVWTGKEMIIWGGYSSYPYYRNDGAAYDPALKSWVLLSASPLQARYAQSAVWTGTEMIIWGGYNGSYLADGAAYKPSTGTWRMLSTSPLTPRYDHQAVWAGTRMIVFGGRGSSCSGTSCGDAAAYDPVADTWATLTPPADLGARYSHVGIATGATGNLATFWGGYGTYGDYKANGATYDPATSTWKSIPAPSEAVLIDAKRYSASSWWGGGRLYVWGGNSSGGIKSNGASYDPVSETWLAMSDSAAPAPRYLATAVWTGSEAIVWGGYSYKQDGKIYRP